MKQNEQKNINNSNDEAKGRTHGSHENSEKQDTGNKRDISEIDQQEGQMKNGETGGAFKSDDSKLNA